MKTNLLILLMLVVNVSIAQETKRPKVSSFFDMPVENLMGIVDFDLQEVAKRVNIKNESADYRKMSRIISWYRTKTDSIYEVNRFELDAIESAYWKKVRAIDDMNNYDQVFHVAKEYVDQVKPFSPPIKALESEMNGWVYGFLNPKQYSKWESYLAKKHKMMKPKTPMPMNSLPGELL